MNLTPYRKTITAVVGATIASLPLLAEGVTMAELVTVITVYATALGVYGTSNETTVGTEAGQTSLMSLLVVVLLVLILLVVTGHLNL